MIHFTYWGKCKKYRNVLLHVHQVICECIKHLSYSLRVPNNSKLLMSCQLHYVINICRNIKFTHFIERIIPKRIICIRIKMNVLSWVLVSPRVSKPYIISGSGKHESWSLVHVVHHPTIRRIKDSMLKVNWGVSLLRSYFPWNSEKRKKITIICCYCMLFIDISVLWNYLFPVFVNIIIGI